jgi:hypothetical protein
MKLCSLTAFFIYKISGEVTVKFHQNPDLCRKARFVQISPIQQTGHFLIAVTHNPLTIWSGEIYLQKAESYLAGWYSASREFEFCLVVRILCIQLSCSPIQFSAVLSIRKIL